MKFTPQALDCNSNGRLVKAHFVLSAEFTVGDVDAIGVVYNAHVSDWRL